MQGSRGLILSMPTLIEHRTASQTGRTPGPALDRKYDPAIDFARCFLRLANLPSYPLDRLSRYEAILWRHCPDFVCSRGIGSSQTTRERAPFPYR